jgi:cell division septation protein DedD
LSARLSEVTVKLRNVAHWTAPGVLIAALLVVGPRSSAVVRGETLPEGKTLPACAPGRSSTHAPTTPAGPESPGACRSRGPILESAVRLTRPAQAGFTPAGYHHLGANTSGEWSGVSGRISVVNGSVRSRSYDFVASRFMVKRDLGAGRISWLEAGWAETGWAGIGAPHIYTFNTNTNTWQFYDQYALKTGDRLWIDIHSDTDGVWGAWLWWNNRWNLLTAQKLPIGPSAYVEQYVEVHVDDSNPSRVDVPPVTVDNVALKPVGGGLPRFWRADVPTLTGTGPGEQQQRSGGFCLTWLNPYDTWRAGDCVDGIGGGLLTTQPASLPSGEAEVIQPSATPSTGATTADPVNSVSPAPATTTPAAAQTSPTRSSTPAPAATPTPNSARRGLLGSLLG